MSLILASHTSDEKHENQALPEKGGGRGFSFATCLVLLKKLYIMAAVIGVNTPPFPQSSSNFFAVCHRCWQYYKPQGWRF